MSDKQQRVAALARELARMLDIESLDTSASIAELGWDSMMLVELAIAAEVVYDRRIDLGKLQLDFTMTLDDILSHIDDVMHAPGDLHVSLSK